MSGVPSKDRVRGKYHLLPELWLESRLCDFLDSDEPEFTSDRDINVCGLCSVHVLGDGLQEIAHADDFLCSPGAGDTDQFLFDEKEASQAEGHAVAFPASNGSFEFQSGSRKCTDGNADIPHQLAR